MHSAAPLDWKQLATRIKAWGRELGFAELGIAAAADLDAEGLNQWLAAGWHGDMDYMAGHGDLRTRPDGLLPGARTVICARLDYWPRATPAAEVLGDKQLAYLSRYALGRDYHKLVRGKLVRLAKRIETEIGSFAHRACSDSAPLLEVELAAQCGLGWRGKHTLLLTRQSGSTFFLGELLTDLPLPIDTATAEHCGSCRACLDACPTGAIVAPYRLDARRCISYLTIELRGGIPEDLRPLIGNRVYGCDDCQLCCPWNRQQQLTAEEDFAVRHGLDSVRLVELFAWNEEEFMFKLEGSPIRRIGHERWLRNLAVGLGNAPTTAQVVQALQARQDAASAMVREHVAWALGRHRR